PLGMRNTPAVTVALALASPVRNCASDKVSVSIVCSSVRAAMSLIDAANAVEGIKETDSAKMSRGIGCSLVRSSQAEDSSVRGLALMAVPWRALQIPHEYVWRASGASALGHPRPEVEAPPRRMSASPRKRLGPHRATRSVPGANIASPSDRIPPYGKVA